MQSSWDIACRIRHFQSATPREKVALMIEEIIVRYYAMLESGFLLRQPE